MTEETPKTTGHAAGRTAGRRPPDAVRALTRGLSILRKINAMGEARPGELAAALGIPRPTVYRLLETLEDAGYVAWSPTSNRVRVTPLAASLGDGHASRSAICLAAGPILAEFDRQLVWPIDLSVYENAAMVIQETTHGRSPLSIDRAMIGYRLPMLRTSAGRAYLAFCGEEKRALILAHLARLGDPADQPFLEPARLSRLLDQARRDGVALRDAGEFRPQTASIAAPVMKDGSVAACVSLIWISSAMAGAKAMAGYGPPLIDLAGRISAAISA
ncbi:DNA-binding transcriptional regulator [Acidimangrovimonas sediminis]|uniref:DNA-binding transcriptional regulator n=1 Tax=Acidimangrovimonas sediminis TaxID=2056283 RepID=UPI000C80F758|nr:DNA-binding transcriptional regulator [Acidimangrovimonas sediminis]